MPSRQYIHQQRNIANGMCANHKDRPVYRAGMCEQCHAKQMARLLIRRPAKRGFHRHHEQSRQIIAAIDWTMTNQEIAKATGLVYTGISRLRIKHAPEDLKSAVTVKHLYHSKKMNNIGIFLLIATAIITAFFMAVFGDKMAFAHTAF